VIIQLTSTQSGWLAPKQRLDDIQLQPIERRQALRGRSLPSPIFVMRLHLIGQMFWSAKAEKRERRHFDLNCKQPVNTNKDVVARNGVEPPTPAFSALYR
jgi:hypothetical protein